MDCRRGLPYSCIRASNYRWRLVSDTGMFTASSELIHVIVRLRRAVVGLVMIGCSADTPDSKTDSFRPAADAIQLAEPAFDSASVAGLTCLTLMDAVFLTPYTREEFVQEYGSPDSVLASTEPNRHVAGLVDSLFQLFYPGLTAGFRKPGGGSDLITSMDVTDNRYLRYPTIGIGARRDRLLRVVPETDLVADDRVEYDCNMGANEPVTFWLADGRIRRVSKAYYVD